MGPTAPNASLFPGGPCLPQDPPCKADGRAGGRAGVMLPLPGMEQFLENASLSLAPGLSPGRQCWAMASRWGKGPLASLGAGGGGVEGRRGEEGEEGRRRGGGRRRE